VLGSKFKHKLNIILFFKRELTVEIRPPRIVSRQTHREHNHPGQFPEEYFRRSIHNMYILYLSLLDSIVTDLEERLSPDVLELFKSGVFLPKTTYSETDLVAEHEKLLKHTISF